jgi:hypothetical protein
MDVLETLLTDPIVCAMVLALMTVAIVLLVLWLWDIGKKD